MFVGFRIFAFYITVKFILFIINRELNSKNLYEIVIVSLVIFILNFIIAIFFPERFINWDFSWIKRLWRKNSKVIFFLKFIIFISPLVYLYMSLGLALFTFSFIKSDVNFLWKEIINGGEIIYSILSGLMVFPFLLLFAFTVFIYGYLTLSGILIIVVNKLIKKLSEVNLSVIKSAPIGFLFFVSFSIYVIFILFILGSIQIYFDENILYILWEVAYKIVKFSIGILPLGWLYELLIGLIARQDKETILKPYFY